MVSTEQNGRDGFEGLRRRFKHLPAELQYDIRDHVVPRRARIRSRRPVTDPSKDPSIPLGDECPLMELPRELRRKIFGYFMPEKDKVIEQNGFSARAEQTTGRNFLVTEASPKVCDILILNKQISSEMLLVLYEERTFSINVYEGIFDGGIEFLNSGLQRLQYQEHFSQVRFKRFEGSDDPFGFSRIKRLSIKIYPAKISGQQEHKTNRHDPMHTHYMLRALVKLLRNEKGCSLNVLHVSFVEPKHSDWQVQPWKSLSNSSPRSSSIHGVSNIEVILRGLMELRNVQTAMVQVPRGLLKDRALSDFVNRFQRLVITKPGQDEGVEDELVHKIEGAKDMLDDWLHHLQSNGNFNTTVSALDEDDFLDFKDETYDFGVPDEDDYYELPRLNATKAAVGDQGMPELHDDYDDCSMSVPKLDDSTVGVNGTVIDFSASNAATSNAAVIDILALISPIVDASDINAPEPSNPDNSAVNNSATTALELEETLAYITRVRREHMLRQLYANRVARLAAQSNSSTTTPVAQSNSSTPAAQPVLSTATPATQSNPSTPLPPTEHADQAWDIEW